MSVLNICDSKNNIIDNIFDDIVYDTINNQEIKNEKQNNTNNTNNSIDNIITTRKIQNKKKTSRNKYINQLFVIKPNEDFMIEFIKLFIPNGFDEYYLFTKEKIKKNDIINKIKEHYFLSTFRNIYMPCKFKKYFENLNEKKIMTIFRQILKLNGYKLASKEKHENRIKKIYYNIIKIKDFKNNNILTFKKNKNIIVNFD
tara:strand:- start:255 stop:854 length:600 start_codon:yes stop_codon:yes gene_type:complete